MAEDQDTRSRVIGAGQNLFRRQGYSATGLKQIATEAHAPFGSIYHFFPGGKQDLAKATLRALGADYLDLIDYSFAEARPLEAAVAAFFDGAADLLIETQFADACPIATIALEVASTNEPLREVTAEIFDSWLSAAAAHFERAGLAREPAQALALNVFMALEGAFLLARARQEVSALHTARDMVLAWLGSLPKAGA